LPIPRDAPVIKTTLFSSKPIIILLCTFIQNFAAKIIIFDGCALLNLFAVGIKQYGYMDVEEIRVTELVSAPIRLYDYLNGRSQIYPTRKSVKKALSKGKIELNGRVARGAEVLRHEDKIAILPPESIVTRNYRLNIQVAYEDDFLAVVDKPAGLITSGNYLKTLVNVLPNNLHPSSQPDALVDFQPVHRLDRATSGLVLIAKTRTSRHVLGEMMEQRRIHKTYRAIVHGKLWSQGTLTAPIDGKIAGSEFNVLSNFHSEAFGDLMLMELRPITGRTHQLRRHLNGIGCPILGDKHYASLRTVMDKGLFLQAYRLVFTHPITDASILVELPVPNKFDRLMKRFINLR
jgi:23S rRNA pseudouridine1911/1915/1917 synthase